MSETTDTVFITKYALSDGIPEVVLLKRENEGRSVKVQYRGSSGFDSGHVWFHGNEFQETREAAFARAEEMRVAKIASHERSIAKLRKMAFTFKHNADPALSPAQPAPDAEETGE